MRKRCVGILCLGLALLLAACGGGGSASAQTPQMYLSLDEGDDWLLSAMEAHFEVELSGGSTNLSEVSQDYMLYDLGELPIEDHGNGPALVMEDPGALIQYGMRTGRAIVLVGYNEEFGHMVAYAYYKGASDADVGTDDWSYELDASLSEEERFGNAADDLAVWMLTLL